MSGKVVSEEFVVRLLVRGKWMDDTIVKPFPAKEKAESHIAWQKKMWVTKENHPARPKGYRVVRQVTTVTEEIVHEEREKE